MTLKNKIIFFSSADFDKGVQESYWCNFDAILKWASYDGRKILHRDADMIIIVNNHGEICVYKNNPNFKAAAAAADVAPTKVSKVSYPRIWQNPSEFGPNFRRYFCQTKRGGKIATCVSGEHEVNPGHSTVKQLLSVEDKVVELTAGPHAQNVYKKYFA